MLSTRTRYSIIALCAIATKGAVREGARRNGPAPVSLVDIAEMHGLSLCYLEQLAVRWRRAGFVKGVRGPQGGYVLRRPPGDISVADIARAMDEAACAGDCDHAEKARQAGCPAQKVFDLVFEQVIEALAAVSLADLAESMSMPAYGHETAVAALVERAGCDSYTVA